jgi:hypothetical protein
MRPLVLRSLPERPVMRDLYKSQPAKPPTAMCDCGPGFECVGGHVKEYRPSCRLVPASNGPTVKPLRSKERRQTARCCDPPDLSKRKARFEAAAASFLVASH